MYPSSILVLLWTAACVKCVISRPFKVLLTMISSSKTKSETVYFWIFPSCSGNQISFEKKFLMKFQDLFFCEFRNLSSVGLLHVIWEQILVLNSVALTLLFTGTHKELLKETQQWLKDIYHHQPCCGCLYCDNDICNQIYNVGRKQWRPQATVLTQCSLYFLRHISWTSIILFINLFINVLISCFVEEDFFYVLPKA